MTDNDLERFIEAQAEVYDQVTQELRDGKKRSHWMWFVFPQLKGLGRSPTAMRFGIVDLEQAQRYLSDPILGTRLRECVQLVLDQENATAHDIFGSPDDLKLRSCLTLFLRAATAKQDADLIQASLDQFLGGKQDELTLNLLAQCKSGTA